MSKIKLSRVPSSYPPSEGVSVQAEVLPWSTGGADEPGLYFQLVDGCGYTVYELTPKEAEEIGMELIAAAKKTRQNFGVDRG